MKVKYTLYKHLKCSFWNKKMLFHIILIIILNGFFTKAYTQTVCDSVYVDTMFLNEITKNYNIKVNSSKIKSINDSTIKITRRLKQVTSVKLGNKLNRFYFRNKLILEIQYFYFLGKCEIAIVSRYDMDGNLISIVFSNHF